jgi:hypothetical protein
MLTEEQSRELHRGCQLYARELLTPAEFVSFLGRLTRPDNLGQVLRHVPAEVAQALAAQTARYRPVKAVGYWRSVPADLDPSNDRFPDPRRLVQPTWQAPERPRLASYLRQGRVYARWRGISSCRFRCAVEPGAIGSRCLTDGEWVWPEGLVHYVEAHDVCLPEEFVATMGRNRWQVPVEEGGPCYDTQGDPDYDFWITWAAVHCR